MFSPLYEESTVAEATAQASGDSGGGLAPFARWQMNAGAGGHGFVHHQIQTALPVFTPDPPILHGMNPSLAEVFGAPDLHRAF